MQWVLKIILDAQNQYLQNSHLLVNQFLIGALAMNPDFCGEIHI